MSNDPQAVERMRHAALQFAITSPRDFPGVRKGAAEVVEEAEVFFAFLSKGFTPPSPPTSE